MNSAGTGTSLTIHYRDGMRIYPCRCGQEHSGDYAQEDYAHHACLHEDALVALSPGQVICCLCGQSWRVDRTQEMLP